MELHSSSVVPELNDNEIDALVDDICRDRGPEVTKRSSLIPILQAIQSKVGYLPLRALRRISNCLGVSPSHVYGVATFYHQFSMKPKGKHIITICRGTACHISGATDIYNFLLSNLKITPPEDSTSDGLFTIKQVRCIGACSLAPVIKIDEEVYGRLDSKKLQQILMKYKRMEEKT